MTNRLFAISALLLVTAASLLGCNTGPPALTAEQKAENIKRFGDEFRTQVFKAIQQTQRKKSPTLHHADTLLENLGGRSPAYVTGYEQQYDQLEAAIARAAEGVTPKELDELAAQVEQLPGSVTYKEVREGREPD
ncbi:hypothetical protein M4951_13750 [Blastopirellula sp. J2-11]|uniref:hypothetical protein n=1 Tax=Blastopirellula sp. J2-11 TaxID=2943192 RepID=UPI0021C76B12|nr:hypothetical protein [Blastopirellula sp. J2-11]UUO04455.1 hypothetical protein M4951_13750 [Blastopirellula sp. J2-11]